MEKINFVKKKEIYDMSLEELEEIRWKSHSIRNQEEVFEPLRARQAFAQFLSSDFSTRKDPYTRHVFANALTSFDKKES